MPVPGTMSLMNLAKPMMAVGALVVFVGWLSPPAAAGTGSASTPIGSVTVTINGGSFTQECTDFPYEIVVSDASPDVQWTVRTNARRGSDGRVGDTVTGLGSGTRTPDLQICSGDGAGRWNANVRIRLTDTRDTTRSFDRSVTIRFPISRATSTTTIGRASISGSRTVVTGTVLDATGGAETTAFGALTIKVQGSDGTWRSQGREQVNASGNFRVVIPRALATGTVIKAIFLGTEEAKPSESATTTL